MIGIGESQICSHWVSLGFPVGQPGNPQNTWPVCKERAAVPPTPAVCVDSWCSAQPCTAVPSSPAHSGTEGPRQPYPSPVSQRLRPARLGSATTKTNALLSPSVRSPLSPRLTHAYITLRTPTQGGTSHCRWGGGAG